MGELPVWWTPGGASRMVHPERAWNFLTSSIKKESEVAQSFRTLWNPARLLHPWDFPGKNTGVGCPLPSPGDHPNLGIEPWSPELQADSLLSEPPGNLSHLAVLRLLCVCICVHAHSVTSDYLQHLWPLCVVFDHITASTLNHKKLSAETTLFLVITGHFHIKQALDKLLLILCVLSHVWLCNPIDCSPPGPLSMEFPRQEY